MTPFVWGVLVAWIVVVAIIGAFVYVHVRDTRRQRRGHFTLEAMRRIVPSQKKDQEERP